MLEPLPRWPEGYDPKTLTQKTKTNKRSTSDLDGASDADDAGFTSLDHSQVGPGIYCRDVVHRIEKPSFLCQWHLRTCSSQYLLRPCSEADAVGGTACTWLTPEAELARWAGVSFITRTNH